MSTRLSACVEGIGLLGPGLNGWTSSIPLLTGNSEYHAQATEVPNPEGLPPAERRRIGRVVKLALSVGMQATAAAGVDTTGLPAVFSSSGSDGHNCHELCMALAAGERQISPTRFHNSVHNAAAGYWSIATGGKAPSNALCAFDASFAAGLLEAVIQVAVDQTRVLLVSYDAQYPSPLHEIRPIPDAFGVALVLSPAAGPAAVARLEVTLADAPPDMMPHRELEALRASIPAARSLPLLRRLASGEAGSTNVEHLDGRSLAVKVAPCG